MIRTQGLILIILILFSCKGKLGRSVIDTPTKGTIHISVDESFRPVIEEEIKLFEATYPETHIIASYKPEAACFEDFISDSATRLAIITRGLSYKEAKYLKDSLGYRPQWQRLATDAVCVIVNGNSTDTLFTLERLSQQLQGKINRDQVMVFDGVRETGTLRFIKDSILKTGILDTSVVKAAKDSKDVIEFVKAHENAIGFVGINWIGNPEDSNQVKDLRKLKLAYVQCDACEGKPYVKPMQQSILTRRYPLVRGLFFLLRENYVGLGSGFIGFLQLERGQLIFRRAYLGPEMDFDIRKVKLNSTLPGDSL